MSDRFVSSLWWLDQLGLLALHEQKVVVRQALVGANYGLLDDTTLAPRPDYFASLLHKRLMGQAVIDVQRAPEADPFLRVYAQCAPVRNGHAAVTVLAINLHEGERSVLKWPHAARHDVDCYQVTAPTLDSRVAFLNGIPMKFDGNLGTFEPKRVRFDGAYPLPPVSYTFLNSDVDCAACNHARVGSAPDPTATSSGSLAR